MIEESELRGADDWEKAAEKGKKLIKNISSSIDKYFLIIGDLNFKV